MQNQHKLVEIKFPLIKYFNNGDSTFIELWKRIDKSKSYFWLLTYIFDNGFSAQITMQKLIQAQKRGVNCMLLIDDLNDWIPHNLKKEFLEAGGKLFNLNPFIHIYKNLFNRKIFHRHHEKIMISDQWCQIGSSNIGDEYSGQKYGTFEYLDINMFSKNICIEQARKLIIEILDDYKLSISPQLKNADIKEYYDQLFPNTKFLNYKVKLLRTKPRKIRDINNFVLNMLNSAKKKIIIIQPYYYPIKSVEKAIINSLKRGVEIDLITSVKRDQPCYARLKNQILMKSLINHGLHVYEMWDKFLHMKAYYSDDHIFTLGSFNNDRFSWKILNEANIIIDGRQEASQFKNEIITELLEQTKLINKKEKISLFKHFSMMFWKKFLAITEKILYSK